MGVWLIGLLLMIWAGVEAWWMSAKVPAQKPGVTELLDALWWLPGPEPDSRMVFVSTDDSSTSQGPIHIDRLDSAGWTRYGRSPKQAASAVRYRNAVGGFRDIQTLMRMRVLPDGWVEHNQARLAFPVILTSETGLVESTTMVVPKKKAPSGTEEVPEGKLVPLNTADSLELIALRGVGP